MKSRYFRIRRVGLSVINFTDRGEKIMNKRMYKLQLHKKISSFYFANMSNYVGVPGGMGDPGTMTAFNSPNHSAANLNCSA